MSTPPDEGWQRCACHDCSCYHATPTRLPICRDCCEGMHWFERVTAGCMFQRMADERERASGLDSAAHRARSHRN